LTYVQILNIIFCSWIEHIELPLYQCNHFLARWTNKTSHAPLMGELDRDGGSSQRELSQRLNISVGLVNTFLKRLVGKGYFKVKTLPRNRLKYFLTPEGLARKTRLTAEYLRYSVNFYRDIKQLLLSKFNEMEANHVKRVLFFGAGEVAELAYLYLQLSRLELAG
jgi:DNA-binding MarR family transcriptional regulator